MGTTKPPEIGFVGHLEVSLKKFSAPPPRGKPRQGPGGAYLGPPKGGVGPGGTDVVRHGVVLGRLSMIVLGPLKTFWPILKIFDSCRPSLPPLSLPLWIDVKVEKYVWNFQILPKIRQSFEEYFKTFGRSTLVHRTREYPKLVKVCLNTPKLSYKSTHTGVRSITKS